MVDTKHDYDPHEYDPINTIMSNSTITTQLNTINIMYVKLLIYNYKHKINIQLVVFNY